MRATFSGHVILRHDNTNTISVEVTFLLERNKAWRFLRGGTVRPTNWLGSRMGRRAGMDAAEETISYSYLESNSNIPLDILCA